jgi:outer membrane biosynthesis protein TonB
MSVGKEAAAPPMLENQFAQGFLSVTAVAVLACGTLALLSAASEFGRQKNEAAAAVSDLIYSNRLSTRGKSEHIVQPPTNPAASAQLDLDSTSSIPDQTQSANTNNAGEPQLSLPEAGVDTKVGKDAKNATLASNTEAVSPGTALNAEPEALTGNKVAAETAAGIDVTQSAATPVDNWSKRGTVDVAAVLPPPTPPKPVDARPRLKKVTRQVPAQAQPSKSRNKTPAKAMTIGQSEKPSSVPKTSSNRWNATGYQAKIWSALAMKKPKAGERGTGALTFVRVARSSGNSRLDQLALGTVRNAAPYPAPVGGPQSYSIRIDFH